MNTPRDSDQPQVDPLEAVPKSKETKRADAEGHTWAPYKPGIEINEKGQLRTVPKG